MRPFALDLSFYSATPGAVVAQAAPMAEKAGFDTLWFGEYYFYREASSVLGYIAALTNSIKLGSGTINIFTRHPSLIAMTAATLDELSKGRFVLGIGYGGFPIMPLIGYNLLPLDQNKPLRRLRATIRAVNALLASETVSEDEPYQMQGVKLSFQPGRSAIPVYIFSEGPMTIARSPRFADGIVLAPGVKDPKTIAERVRMARAAAQGAGKPDFDIATFVYTLVTKSKHESLEAIKRDPYFIYQLVEVVPPTAGMEVLEDAGMDQAAHQRLAEAWGRFDIEAAAAQIPDSVADGFTLCGSPDDCLEKLSELRRLGFSRVGLNLSPTQDMELLVSSISPAIVEHTS